MRLFVCSDLHGFYDQFKEALETSKFKINDQNDLLIICGDLFDRGQGAKKLWNYLKSISNKILIKGNHEDLMLDMIDRKDCTTYDISNGTLDTAYQFAWDKYTQELDYSKLKWIFDGITSDMVDYYETDNYIFVHGWIPVIIEDNLPIYYTKDRKFSFDTNWRNGDWKTARWLSPVEMYKLGFTVHNKTIVCGHWHTSAAHLLLHNEGTEWGKDAIFEPFYDEGIIMLDGCTAYTKKVNMIVLEEN